MRPDTRDTRHRIYLLARVVVARHYRQQLTLTAVADAVSSSPRQVQRAYAQFGELTFREELIARRMSAAAQLLLEQRSISVRHVARLVGYRHAAHFASAFHRRYGLTPAAFRKHALGRPGEVARLEGGQARDHLDGIRRADGGEALGHLSGVQSLEGGQA
jgi:AraC family transcriptional regulator of adaptative response / methylphosphotriester-DNA alkyltransferase methyltransferase